MLRAAEAAVRKTGLDTLPLRMVTSGRRGNVARKTATKPGNRTRRKMRLQGLLFSLLGLLVVASFVLSLIQ